VNLPRVRLLVLMVCVQWSKLIYATGVSDSVEDLVKSRLQMDNRLDATSTQITGPQFNIVSLLTCSTSNRELNELIRQLCRYGLVSMRQAAYINSSLSGSLYTVCGTVLSWISLKLAPWSNHRQTHSLLPGEQVLT
jgi:hypothetical protein